MKRNEDFSDDQGHFVKCAEDILVQFSREAFDRP